MPSQSSLTVLAAIVQNRAMPSQSRAMPSQSSPALAMLLVFMILNLVCAQSNNLCVGRRIQPTSWCARIHYTIRVESASKQKRTKKLETPILRSGCSNYMPFGVSMQFRRKLTQSCSRRLKSRSEPTRCHPIIGLMKIGRCIGLVCLARAIRDHHLDS